MPFEFKTPAIEEPDFRVGINEASKAKFVRYFLVLKSAMFCNFLIEGKFHLKIFLLLL